MTPNSLHQRFEQRLFCILGVDHESDVPIETGDQQQAVDERHMIGHEQRSAGLRHMFVAHDPQAVEAVSQDDEHCPQQGFRQ